MTSEAVNTLLIRKYNQPVPRYTSYPTVPHWQESIDETSWTEDVRRRFAEENHVNGISLYIHLPFCESLCTYCGCNKKITANHSVEEEYLDVIEKEWALYRKQMKQTPVIRELHLGGGTPTFFSPRNLQRLLQVILKPAIIHPRPEFSIEGHPNNTTAEHLKVLRQFRFKRISFGVQDNDPHVQRLINRVQPLENLKKVTAEARKAGFESINYDLIYGLPGQTLESMEKTIAGVIELKPDRIAFYSYAHVPWTSRAQRLFDENDLPSPEEKLQLYLKGKELLMKQGYGDIGMDHFALPTDDLYKAREQDRLYRNFMGYTVSHTRFLIGLGVSAISDTGTAFAQNEKTIHDYYTRIRSGRLAIRKGYFLNEEDQVCRRYILDIACKGETVLTEAFMPQLQLYTIPVLKELEKDGLVVIRNNTVALTGQGHYFIRVVCSAFDLFLNRPGKKEVYSKAI